MPGGVSENAFSGPSAARFNAAHTALIHDRSFQFSLDRPPRSQPIPDWLRWFGKPLSWLAPYVGWLLWAMLGIGLVLVIALIARGLWTGRRSVKAGAQAAGPKLSDWRPDVTRARALLSDADRLAAEGRFAEAARLLLHRSIEEIEQRRPSLVAIAYTSRDIAGLDRVPPTARQAFARIVRQVEYSVFGQHPIDAAAYDECRTAYRDFAFPEAWAGS